MFHSRPLFLFLLFAYILIFPSFVFAQQSSQEACNADIDQVGPVSASYYTGIVNLSDYTILVRDFLHSTLTNPRSNINKDSQNQVNLSDYTILVKWFLRNVTCPAPGAAVTPTPVATLSPTFPPTTSSAEWNQDAHDAQRTGATSAEPKEPWTFAWIFNGSDSNGGIGGHFYDAPKEARTVVGAGKLFVPAGSKGLFGLNLINGNRDWNVTVTSFNAAPAYDNKTQRVFAGGSDGKIYKVDPTNGSSSTYTTGSSIRKAVLVVGDFVYAVTDDGKLHKVNTATMTASWVYSAGSRIDTPPSYSATRDAIVFATQDLNVHAVNNGNGALKWKTKPTPHTPDWNKTFDKGWPVIADQHGIVFLRMQLPHDYMGSFWDGTNHSFPTTNAETRTWLRDHPDHKNLFALSLDNGSEAFIPAVGYGSTEDYIGTGPQGVMGSQPVVKVWGDKEVAYMHFRNRQNGTQDYRWDSNMGEMVLDSTTVSGLVPGDLRFVGMEPGYNKITDEQNPITLLGTTLVHSHWTGPGMARILDRSNSVGLTFANPITTMKTNTVIIRAITNCADTTKNITTHYTSCSSGSYVTDGGQRWLGGPSFWMYWKVADPPGWRTDGTNSSSSSYSAGFQPRYTYASNGYMIVEGNGGDIMVLRHQ